MGVAQGGFAPLAKMARYDRAQLAGRGNDLWAHGITDEFGPVLRHFDCEREAD